MSTICLFLFINNCFIKMSINNFFSLYFKLINDRNFNIYYLN